MWFMCHGNVCTALDGYGSTGVVRVCVCLLVCLAVCLPRGMNLKVDDDLSRFNLPLF